MTERDDLLRAAVYGAHALRGTDAFADAAARVVDCWVLWPLVAADRELTRARGELERCRQRAEAAELDWYASIGVHSA